MMRASIRRCDVAAAGINVFGVTCRHILGHECRLSITTNASDGSSSTIIPSSVDNGSTTTPSVVVPGGVAIITMKRHERKNAIGKQMRQELFDAIGWCSRASTGDVRCVILHSEVDRVFCAGADLKERKEMSVSEAESFVQSLRDTFSAMEDLPMPTISAIDGAALGGGLELALATDIRIAGAKATLGVPEVGLGILPGAGGTFRLPRAVGLSTAAKLAFTGQPIGATEALRIGLVQEVASSSGPTTAPSSTSQNAPTAAVITASPPPLSSMANAFLMAGAIARNGPLAVRACKGSLCQGYGQSRAAAMVTERKAYDIVLASQDRLEGLKAFAEKRPPKYTGK